MDKYDNATPEEVRALRKDLAASRAAYDELAEMVRRDSLGYDAAADHVLMGKTANFVIEDEIPAPEQPRPPDAVLEDILDSAHPDLTDEYITALEAEPTAPTVTVRDYEARGMIMDLRQALDRVEDELMALRSVVRAPERGLGLTDAVRGAAEALGVDFEPRG